MVDDHAVELPFASNLLIVRNDDRPGMIGIVGSALGDAGVSITNMAVGQTSGGGTALMLLSTGPARATRGAATIQDRGRHLGPAQRRRRLTQVAQPDARVFRRVMAHVPTSVAVVAAVVEGRPEGLSVGTFVRASLEPPLVGFFVAKTSKSWPAIASTGSFCVSVLGHDQSALSRRFAVSELDKFEGVSWRPAPSGNPVLSGAVAYVECDVDRVVETGDHLLRARPASATWGSSPTRRLSCAIAAVTAVWPRTRDGTRRATSGPLRIERDSRPVAGRRGPRCLRGTRWSLSGGNRLLRR